MYKVQGLQGPDALEVVYKVLDLQCGQLTRERRADVYSRWERLARRPGESVDVFMSQFYTVLSELKHRWPCDGRFATAAA